ncbi:probable serine/threonine-protein kinase DDB_G0267514 [Clytia hemisphaerica]|uniref:Protein kinase domain-containing protein n=1 Tax=Clytia hemisphaerica TaxID=252671 RepID=A0A7M5UUY8_9CNID
MIMKLNTTSHRDIQSVNSQVIWDQIYAYFVKNYDKNHNREKSGAQQKRRVRQNIKTKVMKICKGIERGESVEEILKKVADYVSTLFKVAVEIKIGSFHHKSGCDDEVDNYIGGGKGEENDDSKTDDSKTDEINNDNNVKTNENNDNWSTEDYESEEQEKVLQSSPKRFKRWKVVESEVDINKRRLENANAQIKRLENFNRAQSDTISVLKEKNASLSHRNAEYTKLKIIQQLGERRSTLMVDASLFSKTFHCGDQLMQEQDSTIIDPESFKVAKKVSLASGTFSNSEKAVFPDGDSVVIKSLNGSFGMQALAVASHEHRILTFLGVHPNIVQTIGLVQFSNNFAHILNFETGWTLQHEIDKKFVMSLDKLKQHILGISSALQHLFSKGVLHNNLVASNIILTDRTKPILMGFTFACRESCGKAKVEDVLKLFSNQSHFAPELFRGSKVTYSSDIYSFGILLQRILKRPSSFSLEDVLKTRLECIAQHCVEKSRGKRLPHLFLQSRLIAIIENS